MTKDELHKYLIDVAAKSTAKKRKVGAVIATVSGQAGDLNYLIVSEGFNNNNKGLGPLCEDINGNTLSTVTHAEIDAINKRPAYTKHSGYFKMFITFEPCNSCKAALKAVSLPYEVISEFMKFDSKKPRMSLVPASLSQGVARALSYGAKKYKVNNWRETKDIECYLNALQRHFDAWREGEEDDPESGLNHLDHIAANLAFITELKSLPKIRKDTK